MKLDYVKRCLQIGEREVAQAAESREDCRALVDHMAAISKPNDGAPKLLLVFARLATTACDWLEGDLRVELVGDGDVSVIEVMSDLGAGMRERVLPSFAMNVPLREFIRAVERVPHMIAPLTTREKTARRVVFTASEATRKSSMAPPLVEIGEDSIFVGDPSAQPKPPKIE
jgi:hypothetical protein